MRQNQHFLSHLINRKLNYSFLIFSLILVPVICFSILGPLQPGSIFNVDFLYQILPEKHPPNVGERTRDYSYGKWVWDEDRPLRRYSEKCPFLDPGFRCQQNGRKDLDYQKWRWQPQGCNLPRFDANNFLQSSQDRRVVFAGDSISRNQWESLICMLAQGVSNQSTIYEEHGNPISKHKGFLSIKFQEHNLTVQYYRVPYLVVVDRPPRNAPKQVKGVIRVDRMHWFSSKWIGADVIVFSAGHWWNEGKTVKSGHYFQEREDVNMTMDVMDAFRISLNTLKLWVTQNLKPGKSHIFLRSYSPIHYRDGTWNKDGYCNTSREPETDYSKLDPEPINNMFIYDAVQQMKSEMRTVHFLNITYLTKLRKDGHPSRNREPGTPAHAPQDCSHWCLPGVPDTWNELLYAELLKMGFRTTPI